MTPILDADTITAFREDGACVLRGHFAAWIDTLREGVAADMAAPGPGVRIYGGEDGSGRFFGDYCNWDRIDEFRRFVFDSTVAPIAAELMGSQQVRLFHEHVLVKEPGSDTTTPWHQDGPYYCVRGPLTCSIWIPLDHVPVERCMEAVAGSQRDQVEFRPDRFNGEPLYANDRREPVPDIESDRSKWNILRWELQPGDAVAFQYTTLHGAPANSSPTTRRAVSVRMVGDGATFVEREGPTSPPFPGLEYRTGDPLEGPQFPVLWPRETLSAATG